MITVNEFMTSDLCTLSGTDSIDDARKITNGIKHFDKQEPVTKTQGGFGSGFDPGFSRPLNIVLSDGGEISADDFLGKIVGFWKEQQESGAF